MAHSVLTPRLLELVRLAASDGDVSAWGRTQQEEDSETASQKLLAQLPVRDSLEKPGRCSLAVWQGTDGQGGV